MIRMELGETRNSQQADKFEKEEAPAEAERVDEADRQPVR